MTDPKFRTLVHDSGLMEGRGGWFYDDYTPDVVIHYGEEGSNVHSILCGTVDSGVYQMTGECDKANQIDSAAIDCQIRTPSRDQGDTRYHKLYGDVMVDADTGGEAINITPGFDNYTSLTAPVVVNNTTRTQVPITLGSAWITARNVALDISWSHWLGHNYLYIWEPRFTEEGGKVYAYSWETCFLTHDLHGYLYHGYLYLVHISTADMTFSIIAEDGTVAASVTIPSSGGLHHKDLIRLPVVKGKIFKYILSSTTQFRVEGQESELLIKAWGSSGPWDRKRIFQDNPEGQAA